MQSVGWNWLPSLLIWIKQAKVTERGIIRKVMRQWCWSFWSHGPGEWCGVSMQAGLGPPWPWLAPACWDWAMGSGFTISLSWVLQAGPKASHKYGNLAAGVWCHGQDLDHRIYVEHSCLSRDLPKLMFRGFCGYCEIWGCLWNLLKKQ